MPPVTNGTMALIVVDLQNDFLPGGALPVPRGDEVVAVANRLIPRYPLVVATQDWHPPDHGSFASRHPGHRVGERIDLDGIEQVLWPDHCVQGTRGAEFVDGLDVAAIHRVIRKGTDPAVDSYSGFFDNGRRRSTGLDGLLREQGVTEVHLVGLATDYCVKYTALDGRSLGFSVTVFREGVRAVDLHPGDGDRALREMADAGVRVRSVKEEVGGETDP